MHDPWIASDGFSYERQVRRPSYKHPILSLSHTNATYRIRGQAILQWFETRGNKSPATGRAMDARLVPNNALKAIIHAFKQA